MKPVEIIKKYYKTTSKSYHVLIKHSESVAKKSLQIAKQLEHLNLDLKFIEEAAMLHDIGIFHTNAPEIECFGDKPYICHGYLGRELLEKEGYPRHALVCERHVGVGLSSIDIERQQLPIPKREMIPLSIEEKIICFADKFFSKDEKHISKEKSIEEIRKGLKKYGENKIEIFDEWLVKFKN